PDGAAFVNTINAYGFRGEDTWRVAKSPGTRRIMFIGDSFVEGIMSDDHHTIPGEFSQLAKRAGESIEVMNLGVSGAGVADYFALIRDAVPVFKPHVLIVVFYANDFPTAPLSPAFWQSRWRPKFSNPWTPRMVGVLERLFNGRRVPRHG